VAQAAECLTSKHEAWRTKLITEKKKDKEKGKKKKERRKERNIFFSTYLFASSHYTY
jgi:hypothetical protein